MNSKQRRNEMRRLESMWKHKPKLDCIHCEGKGIQVFWGQAKICV